MKNAVLKPISAVCIPAVGALAFALAAGVGSSNAAPTDAPKGAPVGIAATPEAVAKIVNPKGEAPYSGPSGTLKGTIRYEGDPPPDTGLKIPSKCGEASATYGKLFRIGLDKALADVLVAVTGHNHFVPARGEAAKITIHGCALKKRTMAVTFGQRIEIANLDKLEPFMPYLDGAPSAAVMVAVPGGPAVKLYPQAPGHYLIKDQLPNPFFSADVFVIAYATHDVTGLDGQYEITGIPTGKVRVSAFLPATGTTVERDLEIKPGDNKLDLTLKWEKKAAAKKPKP